MAANVERVGPIRRREGSGREKGADEEEEQREWERRVRSSHGEGESILFASSIWKALSFSVGGGWLVRAAFDGFGRRSGRCRVPAVYVFASRCGAGVTRCRGHLVGRVRRDVAVDVCDCAEHNALVFITPSGALSCHVTKVFYFVFFFLRNLLGCGQTQN